MKSTNPFAGLDAYSVSAIESKARALACQTNFTISDIDDIEVDLSLHLLKRFEKYDPSRSSRQTFVNRVLDNQVAAMITARNTRRFHHQATSLDAKPAAAEGGLTIADTMAGSSSAVAHFFEATDFTDSAQLRVDIQKAFGLLDGEQIEICNRLAADESIAQIARETGMSRDRIYDRRREIRGIFQREGLDAYLQR